jgi:hypothetical protein
MTDMINLGLRLTMHGGREALVRLVLLVAAVGVGVGLLLVTIAGVNAVNNQDDHYAWISSGLAALTEGGPHGSAEPLWFSIQGSMFEGQAIGVVDVAGTGPASPVPPGIPHLPAPGDYYASPALAALLGSTPAAELGDRFPGHLIGTIGDAALPAPNTLAIVAGYTAAQMANLPGVARVTRIAATPPSACRKGSFVPGQGINADGIDLILSAVAIAILFPVLIFIGTATRLSAARREQRFAAMRLTGATPRQISVIAAVESTAAAGLGMATGFGAFFGLRDPVASIPFTGTFRRSTGSAVSPSCGASRPASQSRLPPGTSSGYWVRPVRRRRLAWSPARSWRGCRPTADARQALRRWRSCRGNSAGSTGASLM